MAAPQIGDVVQLERGLYTLEETRLRNGAQEVGLRPITPEGEKHDHFVWCAAAELVPTPEGPWTLPTVVRTVHDTPAPVEG